MAVLFKSHLDDPEAWRSALLALAPDLDFRVWPETGALDEIEAALVWAPEPGDLTRYPNLRLIASLGAGVDNILSDPGLPPGVPITRIVDPDLTRQMSEYALTQILRFHRRMDDYERQQKEGVWRVLAQPLTGERRVGILGLGVLGGDLARKLVALGFDVAGWSRTPKELEGVTGFAGEEGLDGFLAGTEILVCLLPLTPETEGILDKKLLGALPEGAYLVNCARGEHLIEADLVAALDRGRIAGAALDVYRAEPLAPDHPFWAHPKVIMTPHCASVTTPASSAPQFLDNLERAREGRAPVNLVDPSRGY
jgi:glyoxylate/hydroxypyruvate reductase A